MNEQTQQTPAYAGVCFLARIKKPARSRTTGSAQAWGKGTGNQSAKPIEHIGFCRRSASSAASKILTTSPGRNGITQ